jgi:hypothetical protein
MKKPLNTPDWRKIVAQVLKSTEIEDEWSSVRGALAWGLKL